MNYSNDEALKTDTPLHNTTLKSSVLRDRSGLSISLDSLGEEINTTADLVSNLFHKLDPILFREGDDSPGSPTAEPNGSAVQQSVWDKVGMVARINNQLRELTSRIDV